MTVEDEAQVTTALAWYGDGADSADAPCTLPALNHAASCSRLMQLFANLRGKRRDQSIAQGRRSDDLQ